MYNIYWFVVSNVQNYIQTSIEVTNVNGPVLVKLYLREIFGKH